MAIQDVVVPENLGPEFAIGTVDPGEISLKLAPSLVRLPDGSIAVVAAPSNFYLCQIATEENGNLNTNHCEWSFGNGNTIGTANPGTWGFVLPYPGRIIALSLGLRVGGAGETEVAALLNTNPVDSLKVAGSKGWKTGLNLPFVAGDVLNFRTLAAGGANDGVMAATVLYEVTL